MSNIAIVYYSQGGATAMIAHSVAQGVNDAGAHAQLISIEPHQLVDGQWRDDATLARLANADAIIFGAPAFQGGIAAPFKAFADATGGKWYSAAWRDKLAAGFTVSNSPSGDKQGTLNYLFTFAMQHGMVWVGLGELPMQANGTNRLGSYSGVMAQSDQVAPATAPGTGDTATGTLLGRRVATLAAKLKN